MADPVTTPDQTTVSPAASTQTSLYQTDDAQHSLYENVQTQPQQAAATPTPEAVGRESRVAAVAGLTAGPVDQMYSRYTQAVTDVGKMINGQQEQSVRDSFALQQQASMARTYADVINNPPAQDNTLAQGAQIALREHMAVDQQQRSQWAMEQAAVTNMQMLAATGNQTQATIAEMNIVHGDSAQVAQDFNTKNLVLQDAIDKAGVTESNQGWFRGLTDFMIENFVPLQKSGAMGGVVPVDQGVKNWYDGLLSGQRVEQESSALMAMPLNEFTDYVKNHLVPDVYKHTQFLGYHDNGEALSALTQMQNPSPAWQTNVQDAMSNAALLGALKLAKVAALPAMLGTLGDRTVAAGITANAFAETLKDGAESALAKTGMTSAEVESNLLPTAVNTNPSGVGVSIAADASERAERARGLLQEITSGSLPGTDRFVSEDERMSAYTDWLTRQQSTYGKRVVDVSGMETRQLAGGTSSTNGTNMMLGTTTGSGYSSVKTLRQGMASIGLGGYDEVQDASGQWFARRSFDMLETGAYTTGVQPQSTNILSRIAFNARRVGDIMLGNQAQQGGNQYAKLVQTVLQRYRPTFEGLSGDSKEKIGTALQLGQDNKAFLTDDGMNKFFTRAYGRLPTQGELDAYHAAVDVNDIGYVLRNDTQWKFNSTKGYETVSFDTGMAKADRANGIVTREIPDSLDRNQRIYDVSDSTHYNRMNPITQDVVNQWKSDGKYLVQLQEPLKLGDGTVVRSYVSKGKDITVEPLRMDQVPYNPGLNRIYHDGMYYVKQAVTGFQPDTMEKYLSNPLTHFAGTKAQAQTWADTMEAARAAATDTERPASAADLDEHVFQGQAGYPSGQEFLDGLEDGTFDKEHSFNAMFDRQLPSEYSPSNMGGTTYNGETSPETDWLQTRGALYYSPRGDRLMGWEGDKAPVLDPFKTIDRSLMNVAALSSFSDFKMSAVDRFMQSFGDKLETGVLPPGASDYAKFRSASVADTVPQNIKQGIEAQRDVINRVLGWRSDFDRSADEWGRSLSDWIEGSDPNSMQHKFGSGFTSWWANSNPVQSMKAFAGDLKLGLFNIARLPIHLGLGIASTTMSPEFGLKGWGLSPLVLHYASKAGTENSLDLLAKRGVADWGGFKSVDDMKNFFRWTKQSGFLNINGSHEMGLDHGVSFGDGGIQRLREAGRVFYNTAEFMNRAVASRIAWGEGVAKFGAGAADSAEFKSFVAGRAEDYGFGMSRQSAAAWQRGIASIPTQFWAYNARMLEAMTGNTFTAQQKLRLIVGQSILYGSAGTPIASLVSSMYQTHTGQAPQLDTIPGILDRGIVDEFVYHTTGMDSQVGKRMGDGSFLVDTIQDLFGAGAYGEKSWVDIMGGAGVSVTWDSTKTLFDVAKYMTAESGDSQRSLVGPALVKLASNISTLGQAYKGYMIGRYGILKSNKGTVIGDDIPTQDAWAMAIMGAQPGQERDLSAASGHDNDIKAHVDEASKMFRSYRMQWIDEPDNREDIESETNAFSRLLPPQIRYPALQRANKTIDPSVYRTVVRSMQKEKTLETIDDTQEQNAAPADVDAANGAQQ